MVLDFLAGALAGVLSGCGVGGGTLLLLYLTGMAGMAQAQAQGMNLLYFLPCSAAALISHFKNKLIDKSVALPAILGGLCTTPGASLLATALDTGLLRRLFGVFLLIIGLLELLRKPPGKEA